MVLLIPIVVIALVVAGYALASSGSGKGNGTGRGGHRVAPALLFVAGGAFVLLVLVLGAGFVLRGTGGPNDETTATSKPRPVAPASAPSAPDDRVSEADTGPAAPPLAIVPIQGSKPGRPLPYITVDGLSKDSPVHVQAAGFEPFDRGSVEYCVSDLGRLTTCTGRFPVQFGEDGGADFQYQIPSSTVPGGCAYAERTCSLRVTALSGRSGQAQTVFGEASPGRITVAPQSGLRDGQRVAVSVTGFPPSSRATATVCAPRGGYDVRFCGVGATAATVDVGPDGSGRAELVVRTAALGTEGAKCGPRDPCGVAVVTDRGYVAAPAVPLEFALGPGATYDAGRLALGLSVAVLLIIGAFVLVRRTDWTKPTEAATPEVDAADLQTDQSLDELFGTDEELEERDPLPF